MIPELPLQIGNIEAHIGSVLKNLPKNDSYPDDEAVLWNLSYLYRLHGIALFLLTGEPGKFVEKLRRAACVRVHYLNGCKNGLTGDSKFFTTAKNDAFFDALGIGAFELAAEIASSCGGKWNREVQYEDDFLFVEFLQTAFLSRANPNLNNCKELIGRYTAVLDGRSSPAFNVCVALFHAEPPLVEKAIEEFLGLRSENFLLREVSNILPPFVLTTEPHVDIQGMAIIRLAEHMGLKLNFQYSTVPVELLEQTASDSESDRYDDAWRVQR